jgi:DNA invertase Pin-like site-specific DNA recombinase
MRRNDLPKAVLERRALVYVRQSTGQQVVEHLESQRRQYDLVGLAKEYGFRDIQVIDDDLGCSASGMVTRPGFESLVAQLCQGLVGAVFCFDASRLARNGREWHHLLEMCGLVGAQVIDVDGAYDPAEPNDRLLLGLKGTMSEFELTLIRKRLIDAARAKAARGELRTPVPVGYVWDKDAGLVLDPDRRIQEAIRTVFRLYDRLGSARQTHLHMYHEGLLFPRPADGKSLARLQWRQPVYRNVTAILSNPCYAGAYAYGKSESKTTIVDGRARKTYGHGLPMEQWSVLLWEHHEGYIDREQFERNQERLQRNAYRKAAGSSKSGRGGRALLSGLLRCRRCGRRLEVAYSGRTLIRYTCRSANVKFGHEPCINFGARRAEDAVAMELLAAVQPIAVEAALMAEKLTQAKTDERRRALELEYQQADYEARLAQRRYEGVDPDNRLVAAELEDRWNVALERVRACEARLEAASTSSPPIIERGALMSLAGDLEAVWKTANTSARTKQRLLRALVEEIVVDVDDRTREVILVIHWKGGQHSEVRVIKPKTGEHTCRTSEDAISVIRGMAGSWSDEHIAATLNRMGLRTGQSLSWTATRIASARRLHGLVGYASRIKDGRVLTMAEAAKVLKVTNHVIRKLINGGILPAMQTIKDAPWQIRAEDLETDEIKEAVRTRSRHRRGPCRDREDDRNLVIPGT